MNYQSLAPNMGVKNVNDTVKFYTEVLGFQLVMSNPDQGDFVWAMVSSGSVNIMFQESNNLTEEYPQLAGGAAPANLTFYIKVTGMCELYKKLQNTDYIVKELYTTFYGADEFAIRDINGYILTITED